MFLVTMYGRNGNLVDRYEIGEEQVTEIIRNCSDLHYTNEQHTVVSSMRLLVWITRL